MNIEDYVSVSEAAESMGVSRQWVDKLIRTNKIQGVKWVRTLRFLPKIELTRLQNKRGL
jgi:excisionase family DNA binding protein